MQGRYYLLSYNHKGSQDIEWWPTNSKCSKRQSQDKTLSALESSKPEALCLLHWIDHLALDSFLWDVYFIFAWAWVGIPSDMESWATFAASQVISIFLFQECLGLSPASPFSWVGAVREHHSWGPTHWEKVKPSMLPDGIFSLGTLCDILLGLVPLI